MSRECQGPIFSQTGRRARQSRELRQNVSGVFSRKARLDLARFRMLSSIARFETFFNAASEGLHAISLV